MTSTPVVLPGNNLLKIFSELKKTGYEPALTFGELTLLNEYLMSGRPVRREVALTLHTFGEIDEKAKRILERYGARAVSPLESYGNHVIF